MSESRGESQPEGSGQPSNSSGQPSNSSGQPSNSRPSDSRPSDSRPSDSRPSDSRPSDSRPSTGSGQPRTSGNGQPGGRAPSRPSDPVVDFQRWLMKAGARSMANQVAGQVKRTLGTERRPSGDVWDTATNELPPNESPECQWCPVCQAARAARLGGTGGLGAALSGASAGLATVVQDAFSAFEQVMKVQEQNRSAERAGPSRPTSGPSQDGEETAQ